MRTTEFRGKRKDNGKWAEGCLIKYNDGACVIMVSSERKLTRMIEGKPFYQIYAVTYEVDPATVGEFTGKTDRDDTRVFENDIILYRDDCNEQQIGVCQWCDVSCSFGLCAINGDDEGNQDGNMDRKPIQVIGNTTDNPELMETK